MVLFLQLRFKKNHHNNYFLQSVLKMIMIMAPFFLSTIICSILGSVAFLSLTDGAVHEHILFPNRTLVLGHALISQNKIFQMGFFSPGKSLNRFLGIWYKSTPDVVVWVANRNDPITASSQAPVFMISRNGSLLITSGESIIWSPNPSGAAASTPFLQLLDTGMKMVDDVDAGVERYLTSWKNTDDPSPGDIIFKIQNHGLAQVVALKGTKKRYRIGQWNGMYFNGQSNPDASYKPEHVFREQRLISIREPYDSSFLVRISVDTSGTLYRHTMKGKNDMWKLAVKFPQDKCDEYDSCGPNCICRSDGPIRCQCFKGFEPRFQKDWELLGDRSGGCTRTKPLNCHGGDGFLEVRGVKYPDMLNFWLNTTMSLGECKAECSKNCNCNAYANPFITDGGSGCLMWSGDLHDTKQLSAADSKQNIYIRVPVSELGN